MYFNDQTILYYNGEFVRADAAHTNLYGQTLHYGFGVFEGIRSYDTGAGINIFKSREHFERLANSCRLLGIPFELSVEGLMGISREVLLRNGLKDAYLRPLVLCDPNMTLINGTRSNLMIAAWQWGAYLGERLLHVKLSPYRRPDPRSTHLEAKACGHYINSILATSDAKKDGFDEALLLDVEGHLAEGPGANFFFEKDGILYTAALGHILPGITRQTVFELCQKLEIPVIEGQFTVEELWEADAGFFCGTGAEVIGIQSIDQYFFPKKWADTQGARIREAYLQLVRHPELETA